MKKPKRSSLYLAIRILVILSICILVIFISHWYLQGEWRGLFYRFKQFIDFPRLRDFVLSFGAYSKIVFISLQILQVLLAPIPGEITGFLGGYLYGRVLGTVLSTVGLGLGATIAFEAARFFGTPIVKKIVKKEIMDRFDHFVTHRGLRIVFVLFLIPGFPKDSLCYLLGLTHMRRLDFILMNVFGRLPGTLILALQGEAVRTKHYPQFFTLLAVSMGLTAVLYYFRNGIIHSFTRLFHFVFQRRSH
jgi:uncharacterized membrane protein YdjX (TVP38/TMEM64 family)